MTGAMCSDTFDELVKTSSKPNIQIKQISDNVEAILKLEPSEQCAPMIKVGSSNHYKWER